MSISATMVRDLREKTNAGMMDCKKALQETNGDFEAAVEWLRKKGLASAAKKADRIATEGLVTAMVSGDNKTAVLLEVNSETDFVAKNDGFKGLVSKIAGHIMSLNSAPTEAAALLETSMGTQKVSEYLNESIAKIGENIVVRRFLKVTSGGYLHTYIHGDGKIGVLVELQTSAVNETIKTLANDICLHVAAMSPMALSPDQVPSDIVEKEKEILKAKAIEQGKKPEFLDKIIAGQIQKFLAESCLLEQAFVKNPDLKVKDHVAAQAKAAGTTTTVKQFIRFELGEGLQKKSNNFAEEVAQQAKGH